jgi:hypothetical protein
MKPRVFISLLLLAVLATLFLLIFSGNPAAIQPNPFGSDDKNSKSGQIQTESIISESFSRNLLG